MNVDRRLAEARRHLVEDGIDALLISDPANVRYLTGFDDVFDDEAASVVVITPGRALVYVDSRYVEAASFAAVGGPWHVEGPVADPWEAALAGAVEDGAPSLSLESSVEHGRFMWASRTFEGKVDSVEDLVERIRLVKEDREIERISAAAGIADAAFEHLLGFLRPGLSEDEVALEIEIVLRRKGAERVAFPSIVAAGPNSSKPHVHPSGRRIEKGDFVTLDFGAVVKGYCSDMTRTVVMGSPSDEQKAIYEAVLAANEAGLSALRAGRTGLEVDQAARSVIADRGFGDRFGHGLGHGVGLQVHEAPRLGPRGTSVLPAGTVVTVEPGIYVPGMGGARIEDLAVVGEQSCTVLTHAPKSLIEL